jgi:hypothetical protein
VEDLVLQLSDQPGGELKKGLVGEAGYRFIWRCDAAAWRKVLDRTEFFLGKTDRGSHQYLTDDLGTGKVGATVILEAFEAWE